MSRPEREAYLRALALVAGADGVLAPEERTYIESVACQLKLERSRVLEGTEWMSVREILMPVTDPERRRALLMELVRLAHVDGNFSAEESRIIGEMAQVMEIDGTTLLAIDDWARRNHEVDLLALEIIAKGKTE